MGDCCNCDEKPPVVAINPPPGTPVTTIIGAGRYNGAKAPFHAHDYETTIYEAQCVIAYARQQGFSIVNF